MALEWADDGKETSNLSGWLACCAAQLISCAGATCPQAPPPITMQAANTPAVLIFMVVCIAPASVSCKTPIVHSAAFVAWASGSRPGLNRWPGDWRRRSRQTDKVGVHSVGKP